MERKNNYEIQLAQAKKRFLTYDQEELIRRCGLRKDDGYLYAKMLSRSYRICRKTGDMQYLEADQWHDGNSFGEVLTMLDWLCDSREDRYITGRWINVVNQGSAFHRNLQESKDKNAELFDRYPEAFGEACLSLGGEPMKGADMGYAIELFDGLKIYLQLWHGDEEFAPRLRCLWDENVHKYLRYETTWYAVGLLMQRLRTYIQNI